MNPYNFREISYNIKTSRSWFATIIVVALKEVTRGLRVSVSGLREMQFSYEAELLGTGHKKYREVVL